MEKKTEEKELKIDTNVIVPYSPRKIFKRKYKKKCYTKVLPDIFTDTRKKVYLACQDKKVI